MARRGGKAANRRSKQRKTQRSAAQQRPAAQPPRAPQTTREPQTTTSSEAPSDVFEEDRFVAAAPRTSAAPAARTAASRRTVRDPRVSVAGPSRLGERAMEEYHYVARDLRNIGVLLAIMVVLLIAAFVVFNVLGVTRTG